METRVVDRRHKVKLVFLLEERSMKCFLDQLLPGVLPDNIMSPKNELRKFVPGLGQIAAAKKISKYMDIDRNKSYSFQVFINGVKRLCEETND